MKCSIYNRRKTIRQKAKRQAIRQSAAWLLTALLLAGQLLSHPWMGWTGEINTYAAGLTISKKTGNLLDGKAFDFFGKQNRTGLWYWRKNGGGSLFCVEPQKGMNDGCAASVVWESIEEQSRYTAEQYDLLDGVLRFAHAVKGQNHGISQSDYIVAQSAIWAVLSGEWQDTSHFKDEMEKIYAHLNYASGTEKAAIIKNCRKSVDLLCNDLNGFCGNESAYIPSFASKYAMDAPVHGMEQKPDGTWEAVFLLTEGGKSPLIKDFVYDMPEGWSCRYEGNKVIFRRESGESEVRIRGSARPGTELAKCRPLGVIGFVIPGNNSRQTMIGELEVDSSWDCYLGLAAGEPAPGTGGGDEEGGESWYVPQARQYLHRETFTADYGLELEKRDSETGQLLADSVFNVWEAFDAGQLDGTGLDPDRIAAWDGFRIFCPPETTDENGYLFHRDKKTYVYEKTYCGGHPEPVLDDEGDEDGGGEDAYGAALLSDEEPGGGDDGGDGEDGEADAWAIWQEQVDACEASCDFHAIDDSAIRDMEADRDRTYEDFIGLEYEYRLEEVQPRGGYILHGLHSDDQPIPPVRFSSSQNGGEGVVCSVEDVVSEEAGPEEDFDEGTDTGSGEEADVTIGGFGGYENRGEGGYLTSTADPVRPKGTPDKFAYQFLVENHRTEGEYHINKRDLELYREDPEGSFSKTQGEAVLSGAVYGLYAAQDILHPDGHTGVVFAANDLVSIAATDDKGSASFSCITEVSPSSLAASNREGTWIGHPLLLGNYYLKEISRSEGYELSVYGINLEGSNQSAAGPDTMAYAGKASAGTWFHRINEWDGSWNDVEIEMEDTRQGIRVYVSGYPEDTAFYQVEEEASEENERVVTGSSLREKKNPDGSIIYRKALGGEYRLDEDGNRQVRVDEDGVPVYDETRPQTEWIPSVVTKKQVIIGEDPASPSDARQCLGADEESLDSAGENLGGDESAGTWEEPADKDTVAGEVNRWLDLKGYQILEGKRAGGAPWKEIELAGSTNGEWIESICDFYINEPFWDAASVGDFYQREGTWRARVFYACLSGANGQAVRDRETGNVYVRKSMEVREGTEHRRGYYYVCYDPSQVEYWRRGARVTPQKEIRKTVSFGEDLEECLEICYEPLYQIYNEGELLLDADGNPVPEMEPAYEYETLSQTSRQEIWKPLSDVSYDPASRIYTIRIPNQTDWERQTGTVKMVLRAQAPESTIDYEGEEMGYGDYLLQVKGIGVSAAADQTGLEAGSYMREAGLFYPGGGQVFQDAGTRLHPQVALQRVIKQPVLVEKNISLSSYEGVNTYRIHKDPFTVLCGGYNGRPANTLPGFFFKIYPVKALEGTGLLREGESGGYDYEAFFQENPELGVQLAIPWDRPDSDRDDDPTTLCAEKGGGNISYYGCSRPLPYGRYVVVEQQPAKDVANRHYAISPPQEIVIPFAAQVDADGAVHDKAPAYKYHYDPALGVKEQMDRFHIRFRTEDHVLTAHGDRGDYLVYKYGKPEESEQPGFLDQVYYDVYRAPDGTPEDYGVTKDHVASMKGSLTAVDRKYAAMLVPWSQEEPNYLRLSFENTFYSSKLRIEKLDRDTGENIIHSGAYFKIYAAMRDVEGNAGGSGAEGSGKILWNPDGTPKYDEREEIRMRDATGKETGIFRAYATLRDMPGTAGGDEKPGELTGYIETYQPLGAGVYVLVEVEAPEGYVKSRPVAFEVYSDQVVYYEDGDPARPARAKQYQYLVPLGAGSPRPTVEVSQVPVKNSPTRLEIHKVEAGEETLAYRVEESEDRLKARGDVEPAYDENGEFSGYGWAVKRFDRYSKTVKEDGTAGYEIYVGGAVLSLYEGVTLEPEEGGGFKGVTVLTGSNGETVRITNSNTGNHGRIRKSGQKEDGTGLDIWDYTKEDNPAVNLFFYDLARDPVAWNEDHTVLYGLDERGNRVCLLDPDSGLAYTAAPDGQLIAYPLDEHGNKRLVHSIQVQQDGAGKEFIYTGIQFTEDENGLPVYYLEGDVRREAESWKTSGEPIPHTVLRLPVGAYILEETGAPLEQGYVQSPALGIIVKEEEGAQSTWMENDFTKIEIAKIDITTKKEIPDAQMTLYCAVRVTDEQDPDGYHLEIQRREDGAPHIYTQWISGYLYDDDGNLRTGDDGLPVRTDKPHWIDHIPAGDYILEETVTPHDAGYVHTECMEIQVLETGAVQSFAMEDDYTRWEIHKRDSLTGRPVPDARLSLYEASLGEDGKPIRGRLLVSWKTQKEGCEMQEIDITKQGKWRYEEGGSIYLEYMPVGYYMLVEESAPLGYAAAEPLLIYLDETGGSVRVQQTVMEDQPLTVDLSKAEITGSQEIAGAVLALYEANSQGEKIRLAQWWISGEKPHRITHIHQGDYILTESLTPQGFLQAQEVHFTVTDTKEVQKVSMIDEIPDGVLHILKKTPDGKQVLKDARFRLTNKTLSREMGILNTDESGNAVSSRVPIGYAAKDGSWQPYIYELQEIQAPPGYQLDSKAWEFQFSYEGPFEAVIPYGCEITNKLIPKSPGGNGGDEHPPKPAPPTEAPPETLDVPDSPVAMGYISASYQKKPLSWWEKIRKGYGFIPRTGDFGVGSVCWLLSMACAVGGLGFLRWKKRWSRRLCLGLLFGLLLAGICLGTAASAWAADGEKVRITSIETPEEFQGPDGLWYDGDGELYELKDWERILDVREEASEPLERQLVLEEIESLDLLPAEIDIETEEDKTGRKAVTACALTEAEPLESYWLPDFEFTVTFHSYDAQSYLLGEVQIPFDEQKPQLAGQEEAILGLAGLEPERYQIDEITWEGEAYEREGELCRDARASGRRLVTDYRLTYKGTAVYPSEEIWQCRAVYAPAMPKVSREPKPILPIRILEPEPAPEPAPAVQPVPGWIRMARSLMMVSVPLILLLSGAVLAMAALMKRRRNRREPEYQ